MEVSQKFLIFPFSIGRHNCLQNFIKQLILKDHRFRFAGIHRVANKWKIGSRTNRGERSWICRKSVQWNFQSVYPFSEPRNDRCQWGNARPHATSVTNVGYLMLIFRIHNATHSTRTEQDNVTELQRVFLLAKLRWV